MDRRDFFKATASASAALAAAAAVPSALLTGCTPAKKPSVPLNLCLQEGRIPGENLNEKLDYLEKYNVVGLEPGGKNLLARADEINKALEGRNVKISAICAGFQGFILAEDPEVKALFDSTMREIITAAGKIGSTGVIMVPAFNRQVPCKPHNQETRDYLCEEMAKLGEYALSCGTTVILEPLNRKEAFYLRQVGDAAAICRDANNAGVKCMGDFWHMQEETNDYAALMAAGTEYLQHVHIASRGTRHFPGEDGEVDNYVNGFRALKEMGYDKYVSFECGAKGDPLEVIPAALQLVRDQWEQA